MVLFSGRGKRVFSSPKVHIGCRAHLIFIKGLRAKIKVKVTLVQALRPCTGRSTHRGRRGIALSFHDHGNRRGWRVSVTTRSLFTPVKGPVPIVQEAGWAPGPVWTGAENLASTGIPSPERPAHSQSLYRWRYPPTLRGYGDTKRPVRKAGDSAYLVLRFRMSGDISPLCHITWRHTEVTVLLCFVANAFDLHVWSCVENLLTAVGP